MYLQSLVVNLKPKFFGNGTPVPFHKRGIDIKNTVAIRANDLGLEGGTGFIEGIKFVVLTHINFAHRATLNQEGKAAVYSGPGDGIVHFPSILQQLVGSKMAGLAEEGIKDRFALPGHTQALGN